MMDATIYSKDMLWMLSTGFGQIVFVMTFLTWGLLIIDLFLLMILLVRKIFGKNK